MSQQASFDFDASGDDDAPPGASSADPPTYTVAEMVGRVNRVLRDELGRGVWVRGEVHSFTQRNGHRYFNLVDDAESRADVRQRPKLRAAVFAKTFQSMRGKLEQAGLTLQDGLTVRVRGAFDFYGPSGSLSFKINAIDPEFTLGNLALQRDLLLRQLVADGSADLNGRLPMPVVPLRVGVVTSPQSDGWHDFRRNLRESGIGFHLLLAPVTVQGATAPVQVARALHQLGERDDLDVVAIIRGGGSKSDLAAFDHERIARAIAACPYPVLTGIGHDADQSVADRVAHTAIRTPTGCAQTLIDRIRAFTAELDQRSAGVTHAAERSLLSASTVLERARQRVEHDARRAVRTGGERLDRIARHVDLATRGTLDTGTRHLGHSSRRVAQAAERRLQHADRHLDAVGVRVDRRAHDMLRAEQHRLDAWAARVQAIDPAHALARGWTITTDGDGRVVRSVDEVSPGVTLTTRLRNGRVRSTVVDVEADES